LHGQLARICGGEVQDDDNLPEVKYAKAFAVEVGRGSTITSAFDTLVNKIGIKHAKSVNALCWALLWGKTTGNTLNNARDKILKLKLDRVTSIDLFILCYYGPLFSVIGILNKILLVISKIPKVASAALGATLWLPQAINITPLGVFSLLVNGGVV